MARVSKSNKLCLHKGNIKDKLIIKHQHLLKQSIASSHNFLGKRSFSGISSKFAP